MINCEFVGGDGWECPAPPTLGVSVRHRLSDTWQVWPACAAHVEPMANDLQSIGFVVTVAYELGDDAARLETETYTDRLGVASGGP